MDLMVTVLEDLAVADQEILAVPAVAEVFQAEVLQECGLLKVVMEPEEVLFLDIQPLQVVDIIIHLQLLPIKIL